MIHDLDTLNAAIDRSESREPIYVSREAYMAILSDPRVRYHPDCDVQHETGLLYRGIVILVTPPRTGKC